MKSIVPTVITIIGITIITLTASCLITFQLQITAARNFHANCISRIQSSYYNTNVINECKSEASDRGYTLTVQDVSIYKDRKDVLVKLDYKASMLLFDLEKETSIEGFAK